MENDNNTMQIVVVEIGSEKYGVQIEYVTSIVKLLNITRVPETKDFIRGVVNLRGDVIPVISTAKLFGLNTADTDENDDSSRIVFLKIDGNNYGIIVDKVYEVVTLNKDEIEFSKDVEDKSKTYILGVGRVSGNLVTVLDTERLLG